MNTTSGNYPAAMRASDADRDAVLSDLSEHFQAGRLTAEEFDERAGQTLAARTWGELKDLLRDLPATRPGPRVPAAAASSGTRPERLSGRRAPVPIPVLVGIGIAIAVSVGIAHGWGLLWLVFAAWFIARRLHWWAGAPTRSRSGE
jgi:uncharacterized protein DUF1707